MLHTYVIAVYFPGEEVDTSKIFLGPRVTRSQPGSPGYHRHRDHVEVLSFWMCMGLEYKLERRRHTTRKSGRRPRAGSPELYLPTAETLFPVSQNARPT